ncbi:hypothetical protein CD30_05950 [Ureibacillus massiliensis 4400831 = CIP 108448 = CCUG 49529]|uniref:GIY-YIG domain-containing protein n=1 Tax=Ureibacillus massiliensis 4400831 = CIP 108448 = CCUG 49529 TaxID=1211035 RepID=A0A0A3J884_9BACL|nr:GIY-YIG nuclease family protein [Ureibacillus massiliensis]KGR91358.1 hypothetical protein CD30_05950 [Ureibacillus massiliensis 4400831 = CIP 108448 = CCUG 49529]
MKEWDGIERMGYKIPEDDGVVMISDYKQNVKEKAGVYRIYNEQDRIMYVGQSHNLKRRIGEHFRGKRKGYYIYRVRYFYVEHENNFILNSFLDLYETLLIRKLNPRYNKQKSSPMRYI